jgi:hypothetical protein
MSLLKAARQTNRTRPSVSLDPESDHLLASRRTNTDQRNQGFIHAHAEDGAQSTGTSPTRSAQVREPATCLFFFRRARRIQSRARVSFVFNPGVSKTVSDQARCLSLDAARRTNRTAPRFFGPLERPFSVVAAGTLVNDTRASCAHGGAVPRSRGRARLAAHRYDPDPEPTTCLFVFFGHARRIQSRAGFVCILSSDQALKAREFSGHSRNKRCVLKGLRHG